MKRPSLVPWAAAAYRRALVALPAAFRRAYATELAATFERIAAEARVRRGRLAVLAVLLISLADLAARATREWLAVVRRDGGAGGVGLDLLHATRRLLRRPSFSAASIIVLGLGVAGAVSVFTLVYGVVLRPLPYPGAGDLVVVDHGGTRLGLDGGLGVTFGVYRLYAERSRDAAALAMYRDRSVTLTGAGDPVRLRAVSATPSLAAVLGVPPRLGRWFSEDEGQSGASPVVVLSHGLWREWFGGDAAVIGRAITLDGAPVEVVGVMPEGFAFPDAQTDLWTARDVPVTGVGGWNDQAVARLAPGRAAAELERELTALLPGLVETGGEPDLARAYLDDAGVFPRVVALKESVVGDVRARLWILLGSVGLVLLIAVANVANLFLVRAEDARAETSVRAALGASRARLLRGWLAESLLLAGAAGALGTAGAWLGVALLRRWAPVEVPRLDEVALHGPALAVALGLCLVAGLLVGLVPALQRSDIGGGDHGAASRSTADRSRLRGRNVLVAAQVALAFVLLIGSGLLLRTFRHMQALDPGFAERMALTFELGLPPARYETREAARLLHVELAGRLAALPGVESVATLSPCLPLSGNLCSGSTLRVEGGPPRTDEVPPVTGVRIVTGDYFGTMGIRVRGRAPTDADAADGSPVAVLSEATAEAYFPGEDPVGRRLSLGGTDEEDWLTVVGVAGNVKAELTSDGLQRLIYLPALSARSSMPPIHQTTYVLKASAPPESLVAAARDAVWALDDALPVARVRTLEGLITDAIGPASFALALVGLAAALALVLGLVGVYAVLAYAVSRRTAEVGLRMALGAGAADVRWMVFRQGAAVVSGGLAAGLLGAFALTRTLRAVLFGVEPTDPATFLVVTLGLATAAAAALWLPARRAARVSPLEALRHG